MRSIVAAGVTALCAALGGMALLAQEGPPPAATAPAAPPPHLPLVTAQDLLDGLKHPGRWLTYSGDYTGRRHSPLKQITPDNVARLAAQWTFQAEGMVTGRGFEGTPLVMDGVMYISGNNNTAWAIDARTGRQLWRYRRQLPTPLTYGAGNASNRGFAALGDRLFMATLDAHLLAFDRNTGQDRLGRGDGGLQAGPRRHRRAARREGQGDRRQLRRRSPDPRLPRRLRCADRQAGLALLHRPGEGRARQRDVVVRRGVAARRRRHLGDRQLRPRAEPSLLGHRQSQPGLLRRRPHGRQPLHGVARRARRRHRQAALALPVHAARPARLGLEPRAGAGRPDDRRPRRARW